MQRRDYVLLTITALCWGSSFMFIKVAIREVDPLVVTAGRMLIGAVLLLMVARYRRMKRLQPGESRSMTKHLGSSLRQRPWSIPIFGLLTAAPLTLVAVGEQRIDSGLAGIVNASVPLWATLLALKWDSQHRTTTANVVGVVIGFSGVVALAISRGALGQGATEAVGIGIVACASAMYAIGAIVARERLTHLPSIEVAMWSVLAGSILIAAPAAFSLPDALPSLATAISVLALGIFGTFLGFLTYYELMMRVGASRASMVTYLLPPIALIYGAIFLNESIPADGIVAMMVILAGVWIGSRRRRIGKRLSVTAAP